MNNLVEVSEQLVVAANLEGKRLEQVRSFGYLGSLVSDDIKCDSEIRSRIAMGKAAFGQMRTILRNLGIDMQTKMRLLNAYVWSVMLFGCESWTTSKEMKGRMLRIPWT